MKAIVRMLTLAFVSATLTACIHEFPEPPETRTARVVIRHSAFWDNDLLEIPSASRSGNPVARYIIRAYPRGMRENFERPHIWQHICHTPIERADFAIDLDLPVGDWELHVWSDAVADEGAGDLYYSTDDFTNISLIGTHSGSNDMRDAFAGNTDISVPDGFGAETIDDIVIDLERPLARYEFIATDFTEFLEKETDKMRSSLAVGDISRTPDLSQYKILFAYSGYMPSSYNRFVDDAVDSSLGVVFEGNITPLDSGEASIGFDHVFVNHKKGGVVVRAFLETPDGKRTAISSDITVPLSRSVNTLVKGRFLTSENKGGLDIEFDFEGDFNIYL